MLRDLEQCEQATRAIRKRWNERPKVGIILGTGLGDLARDVEVEAAIGFDSIPHFPRATALGHRGRLVCGRLCGTTVVAMDGRLHAYEGYTLSQVGFPVRVMHALGIEILIISNASGGMHPAFCAGDVMIVEDHVNFTFDNPLVGPHDGGSEVHYPDMSRPYDLQLIERATAIARRNGFPAHCGTYVGVRGPNYETRAEYRFFRQIGGDVVGMSTIGEMIVAAQCRLRVLALSVVTNVCFPDQLAAATGEQVVAVAAAAGPKVRAIVCGIVAEEAEGMSQQHASDTGSHEAS